MSVASASTLTTAAGAGAAATSAGVDFVPYSPCDFLLTWSNDIRLYRITEKEQTSGEVLSPSLGFRLSSRRIAEVSNFIPKTPHYVKCVSVGNVKGTWRIMLHIDALRSNYIYLKRCWCSSPRIWLGPS